MKNMIFAAVLTVFFAFSTSALGQTVVVTGNTSAAENQPGWMFNRDSTSPFAFTSGNASIGSGSLSVGPISSTSAHKFVAEYFHIAPLSTVDSISYDFKLGSAGLNPNQYYMNVYLNFEESADDKFYDCRYNIVPTVGSDTQFTTVTFDPSLSYGNVTTRNTSPYQCPAMPSDMGEGATIRAFAINLGDSASADIGYTGYFDKVVLSTTSGVTTFDFEPVLSPTTAESCKKGGWMTFNTPAFRNQGECVSYVVSGK